MPPDSTYILQNMADSTGLPDSIQSLGQEAIKSVPEISTPADQAYTIPSHNSSEGWLMFFFMIAVAVVVLLIRYWRLKAIAKEMSRIFEQKKASYHKILDEYNPYYKSLGASGQERFIRRTIFFMQSKHFQYVGIDVEEKMPVLISATAIQLTFGLKHYLLDYFKTIYVMKDNYRYGLSAVPFEGHVNDNGIYLSWNNFIREYSDYTDGENVGLHEMAHALIYVNFTVQDGMDYSFRYKFHKFSRIGRPIFARMQHGETNLLNKYGATSYDEFWAVCIESFFERPFPFREQMPHLYYALCRLLNQDPSTKDKILISSDMNKA